MFDTRAQESIVSETDLISGNEENLITQNFVANDTRKLEELTLKFKNTLDGRVNMAMLSVKLIDSENAQCIYQNQIGCSSISNDVDLKIDLKKTKVIAGKKYQLQLTGMRGVTWYTDLAHLYPYFTPETTDILETASINGTPITQQLYMELR
ncbi:hypothetical protein [Fusicatenibacter saccharivorans]|uniref:hypothetical protein n=1 Tax=Fusicatenibacter saccharivorans TaxID=1150298 RepID=UPI003F915199